MSYSRSGMAGVPFSTETERKQTGFAAWGDTGAYFSIVAGVFNLLRGGRGYIKGLQTEWSKDQSVALTANACNYLFVDDHGVLDVTVAPTDADFEDNIMLFAVLDDGAIELTAKANRDFAAPTSAALYLMHSLGPVIRSSIGSVIGKLGVGGGGAAADRQINLTGAGILDSFGLTTTLPTSPAAALALNIFYLDALGNWVRQAQQTELLMSYNNAGAVAALTLDYFGIYRIYVAHSTLNAATPQYIAVMHSAEYVSLAAARAVVDANGADQATDELEQLGLCCLGVVIVENNAAGGQIYPGQALPTRNQLSNVVAGQLAIIRNSMITGVSDRVVRNLLCDPPEVVVAGTWLAAVDVTQLFNGTYNSNTGPGALNDEITANIHVPSAGVYRLRMNAPTLATGGIVAIELDGVQIGVPAGYDLYAAVPDPLAVIEIAALPIAAGPHTLGVVVTGQNVASGGFDVQLSQIELVRTA